MPRADKRRKRALAADGADDAHALRGLLSSRNISKTTLSQIIATLREHPALLESSIGSIEAPGASIFESVKRSERVDLQGGGEFRLDFCDPNLLMSRMLHECTNLAELYVERLAVHPCSESQPWSLVVIWDEFTPGSIAHPQPYRKTLTLAYNFLELGAAGLAVGSTWFVPVSVRTKQLYQAVGGLSNCLARYLRAHLLGDLSIQTVGVSFVHNGHPYTIWARLTNLCADGEGLKLGCDVRGHAGLRPCTRCQNVLKKDSGLAHRRPGFVEITCADYSQFVLSTPDDLNREVDAVLAAHAQFSAGGLSANRLNDIEKAHGINANPTGLLADLRLKQCFSVVDVLTEDWMHGALQDGILNCASQCLLDSVSAKLFLPIDGLTQFLKADWQFPKVHRQKLRNVWRIADSMSDTFQVKATASELLGFYVLLRHFVRSVVVPTADRLGIDIQAELQPFLAACKVVDYIMLLKRGHADAPHRLELLDALQSAVAESIASHIAVYGTGQIRPKHHRMQHISPQIRRDGFVLDCFVIERLHLVVREILANVHNPVDMEGSLLRGICLKQMMALKDTILTGLIGPTAPLRDFPLAAVATRMRFCGMDVSAGDVVTRNAISARVTACAVEDNRHFVLVELWQAAGIVAQAQRWRRTDHVQAWPAEEIELAAAWYADGEDVVVLLVS